MPTIGFPVISVLGLAGLAWLAGGRTHFKVCPICFGVAGTWAWMLGARFAGLPVDATMLAVLLGASVVGGATRLEAHLAQGRSPLLWKTLAVAEGVAAAYGLVAQRWDVVALAVVALLLLAAWFLLPRRVAATDEAVVRKLEEQMKKCC
jgi:hypothetical protein